jgi:hypothetical protein
VIAMPKRRRIPGQQIRNTWHIKPITRIHDNDVRKNKKAQRQKGHQELKNWDGDRDV